MPSRSLAAFAASSLFLFVGCGPTEPTTTPAPPPPAAAGLDHGHSHSHSHSHDEAGPHGGHLVELGHEEYHVEWTHDDDDGTVTVYILDGDAKKSIAIESSTVTIETTIEDTVKYELAAIDSTGDPPLYARFRLKDPALLASLKMAGQGAEAIVKVTIEGNEYTGKFEHHEHDHGHQH